MTSTANDLPLRERAIALRLEGKSIRQIKEALGSVGSRTLSAALRDTPPAEWTRRPNAKDDLRVQARELRTQGLSYNEIAAQLDVSKSSISLWVRDIPCPPRFQYVHNENRQAGLRKYHQARAAERAGESAAAADEIGELTNRELLIAGAIAYWCEGTKSKPYRHAHRVIFMNSDPGLVLFFLRFLDTAGVQRTDLTVKVHIHESADVGAAQRFWERVTELPAHQFGRPTLKRHNPTTVRKTVGESYHGCLRIEVQRSAELYRRIEGWVSAATASRAVFSG
jgi:hypothetical protein